MPLQTWRCFNLYLNQKKQNSKHQQNRNFATNMQYLYDGLKQLVTFQTTVATLIKHCNILHKRKNTYYSKVSRTKLQISFTNAQVQLPQHKYYIYTLYRLFIFLFVLVTSNPPSLSEILYAHRFFAPSTSAAIQFSLTNNRPNTTSLCRLFRTADCYPAKF